MYFRFLLILIVSVLALPNCQGQEKPGTCPKAMPIYNVLLCPKNCDSDEDCDGELKCCVNGCGSTECSKPVVPRPPGKPGTCPNPPSYLAVVGRQCPNDCSNDDDCKGEHKCCPNGCDGGSMCLFPQKESKPLYKPGTCPLPPSWPQMVGYPCPNDCSNDRDCEGDSKCCPNGCDGGSMCLNPEKESEPVEKPGTCPNPPAHIQMVGYVCPKDCTKDEDCKGDRKCCPNGCDSGKMCLNPKKESKPIAKPGTCPNPPSWPQVVDYPCPNECSNDGDCKGESKCCPNGCDGGNMCLNPEETFRPAKKPGSCPEVKPDTVGICANLCNDDYSCEDDLLCCSNGCGTTCVKPVTTKKCSKTNEN